MTKPKYLQIGVSRLENLPKASLDIFLSDQWVHLGEKSVSRSSVDMLKLFARRFSECGIGYVRRQIIRRIFSVFKSQNHFAIEPEELYLKTNFQEFYFSKGDKLPFENETFEFIFSEHFFEHLFVDEALALFEECWRILKPGGVIRTVVPDADLRTSEMPEKIGYPGLKVPFTSPSKHKTRWSVYSLVPIMRCAGFQVHPISYCDKNGNYENMSLDEIYEDENRVLSLGLIKSNSYIIRQKSLIVDGVKPII